MTRDRSQEFAGCDAGTSAHGQAANASTKFEGASENLLLLPPGLAVPRLFSVLRRSPWGRFWRYLRQTRSRHAASGCSTDSDSGVLGPTLPMHLPAGPGTASRLCRRSPRRRQRHSRRSWAHLWAEGLVSLHTFFELGSPRGPVYMMPEYSVSGPQAEAFSQLVSDVLPFCRLATSVEDAGRGQLHFLEALARLES